MSILIKNLRQNLDKIREGNGSGTRFDFLKLFTKKVWKEYQLTILKASGTGNIFYKLILVEGQEPAVRVSNNQKMRDPSRN